MKPEQHSSIPQPALVLGYFIPLGVFLGGAYLYNERKRKLGRKPHRASDLEGTKSSHRVAYEFDVQELVGVETTVYPSVGQTVRVHARGAVGYDWNVQVEPPAAVKVEQTSAPTEGVGSQHQIFLFTLRQLADARVTLTQIGPGNQVIDSVAFDIDAQE